MERASWRLAISFHAMSCHTMPRHVKSHQFRNAPFKVCSIPWFVHRLVSQAFVSGFIANDIVDLMRREHSTPHPQPPPKKHRFRVEDKRERIGGRMCARENILTHTGKDHIRVASPKMLQKNRPESDTKRHTHTHTHRKHRHPRASEFGRVATRTQTQTQTKRERKNGRMVRDSVVSREEPSS